MDEYKIKETLENIFSYLDHLNKYLNDKAPWNLLKDESNIEEVRTISHELNASAYEKVHNFMVSIQDLIDKTKVEDRINKFFLKK